MSENGGNRLQIFDSQGNFVRIVGAGEVLEPQHLFVDADDNILVADSGNHRIQVFNQNGDHIKTIGAGELSYPNGVCMDGKGKIIASDCGSGQASSFFLIDCVLFQEGNETKTKMKKKRKKFKVLFFFPPFPKCPFPKMRSCCKPAPLGTCP